MSAKTDSLGTESFLKSHPRLVGALFMVLLLLGQAGNAAAGTVAWPGP